jgi:TPP-dependent pyruvate/acetoin dehydrogenase alpha subunit
MQALTEEDNVLCTYREHGMFLARGIDVIMAEMYGKIEGFTGSEAPCIYLTFQNSMAAMLSSAVIYRWLSEWL